MDPRLVSAAKEFFNLPLYDAAVLALIREINDGMTSLHPHLGRISKFSVEHGGTIRQVSGPEILDSGIPQVSVFEDSKESIFEGTDIAEFIRVILSISEKLQDEQMKLLYELTSAVSDATGNSVAIGDRNYWEAHIESLENLQMFFDEDGRPTFEMHVGPKWAEWLRENQPSDEQRRRIDEIIDRKRREYYATKRTRRLSYVD